ncbi:TPA: hydroxyethylthiazole kinase [Methanosarcina acetivorans]|uniref:Hydroxyethylthiazole kinase n=2 Tax=Methanosarcina acetivorans TaxID=2214 RepID=THIM_METAC|nr:hydroxyethylthiazole kinase [Methanosarcina acetivorans]Q8TMD5.1 RecName: Full=Hydroxyethylthiazole kinase; AltName: Full=4-methyl-5-beta-hydroxyethylthiazole kinase; Short=TH kinase; Short=Thz kinase [Methanosarcina acetivorans C2A]AAM06102.1 hydroxyethylthiazole kinase [Methanosarcina acetivorans C2A]HIH93880.1 hydroxyethylthiazole kinase [Methanosarcina acetivorans]
MNEPLKTIRETKPLIHHITNWVTIYECANMTRAFGALPVMAHAPEECADMTKISSALVLNIGTLTSEIIDSMLLSAAAANERDIPVVLDAVGVGATKFRDEMAAKILASVHIDIIKGNYSEIAKLAGENAETKGVEATSIDADPAKVAKAFAKAESCVVVMTGKEDIISDGDRTFIVKNGHELMGSIVGTGCMAASIVGLFAAVNRDYCDAAKDALCYFGASGELAAAKSSGPGSFKVHLYDEVFNLSDEKVKSMKNFEEK